MNHILLSQLREQGKRIAAVDLLASAILGVLRRTRKPYSKMEIVSDLNLAPLHMDLIPDAIQQLANRDKIRFSGDRQHIEIKDIW